ncbi:response regulator transcription factor [Kutzneria sp. NPDC052558]|uniref:response regulator transcription factor n=1 Tax=Kutzneria sp. NPDC052558 TaxID=3364121 RepID=UPI0037C7E43D
MLDEADVAVIDIEARGAALVDVVDGMTSSLPDLSERLLLAVNDVDVPILVQLMHRGVRAFVHRDGDGELIVVAARAVRQRKMFLSPDLSEPVRLHLAASAVEGKAVAVGGLTAVEREVFRLVARGLPNARIADQRATTVRTVKYHVSNILRKLELSGRSEIIALAHGTGDPVPMGSPVGGKTDP